MINYNNRRDTVDHLRPQIKHLLAQELSLAEIAVELGVNTRSIQAHVAKYQLYYFVQPGKRKQQWREACAKVKRLQFEGDEKAIVAVNAAHWFQSLRSKGFTVDFADVEGEANAVFCKCKANNKRPDDASFKTFFEFCLTNHMKNWMKKMSCDLLYFTGE